MIKWEGLSRYSSPKPVAHAAWFFVSLLRFLFLSLFVSTALKREKRVAPDGNSERCHSQWWLATLLGLSLLASDLLCLHPAGAKTSGSSLRKRSTLESGILRLRAAGTQKRGKLRPAFAWLQQRTTRGSEAPRLESPRALGSVAMENQVLTPHVYWAQRHRELYLRVELSDVQVKAGMRAGPWLPGLTRNHLDPPRLPDPLSHCAQETLQCANGVGAGPCRGTPTDPGPAHDPLRAAGPFGCCVGPVRTSEAVSGLLFGRSLRPNGARA